MLHMWVGKLSKWFQHQPPSDVTCTWETEKCLAEPGQPPKPQQKITSNELVLLVFATTFGAICHTAVGNWCLLPNWSPSMSSFCWFCAYWMRSLIFFSDDKSDTGLFEKIEKTLTNSTEGKKKWLGNILPRDNRWHIKGTQWIFAE